MFYRLIKEAVNGTIFEGKVQMFCIPIYLLDSLYYIIFWQATATTSRPKNCKNYSTKKSPFFFSPFKSSFVALLTNEVN